MLDEVFITSLKGVYVVLQGNHQAGGQVRASSFGDVSTVNHFGRNIQFQVFDLLASAHLAGKEVVQRNIDFLLKHSVGQNGQWMTQIDHLIEVVAKEIADMDIWSLNIPRKQAPLNIKAVV